ncbi:hypothetical protein F511_24517 [Dorcoceras hygrometricum]|uniref:Uncharacterized protein n=1 Tax=Dorcoceras hygrometricum TaxID=472368 RepID=A0A2Z7D779_9LAMI|nr:hypothetical protein F511_24517 [Dorcoceras hygrometricum]
MASSLISNTNQVHFASVLAMDNAGMVDMFEALVASGLNGFLGCMSDIFETALVEFYQNAFYLCDPQWFRDTASRGPTTIVTPKSQFRTCPSDHETDSTKVALQRRSYILTKYRELLLRKFLETRKSNFVSGTPSSAIDLQVLDKLSDLHLFVLEELKTQTHAHGLSIRQEIHDQKTLLSLDFITSHKRISTQENYNNITTQLGELVDYINRGGNDKNGEESSSRRPQPPPDDQNRPSGGSASRGSGSGGSGRRDDRRYSSKKRRSSGGGGGSGTGGETYGPYKKNAEWWLYGKNQF